MKRIKNYAAILLIIVMLPLKAAAAEYLVPVGEVIGLHLRTDTVTVAAFDDLLGTGAKEAGLRIGDQILEIDQVPVPSAQDVSSAISGKTQVNLTVRRGCKQTQVKVPLRQTEEGTRLGVYLRQGISGIGTVTWYDPQSGTFGALGHGVSDGTGALLQMTEGQAYYAGVDSVKQGKSGHPGQLRGIAEPAFPCGALIRNTPQGVIGITEKPWQGNRIPVARYDEIQPGPAQIRSTVGKGGPQDYSVEIVKIYPKERTDCRHFLLRVTDPDLLSTTGGIVQGMSGSPIIQDGKLVGAVTHVLVNDPTRGYGIFIENMLDAAA